MKSVLVAFAAGVVVSLVAAGILGGLYLQRVSKDLRRGWNPLPVVVASADLAEGDTVTFDRISQRELPEQFVTDSNVKPDQVKALIGRKVSVPVQAGDPLVWGLFVDRAHDAAVDECLKGIHPKVQAAFDQAVSEAGKAFSDEEAPAVPQPHSERDADGYVKVVAVNADLAEGAVLTREQLQVVKLHESLVTESVVPAGTLPKLVGKKLGAPMSAGEVVIWQLIDPGGPLGCQVAAAKAASEACARAAVDAAAELKKEAR